MHEKLYSILRKSSAALLLLFASVSATRAQYCTSGLFTAGCTDDDYIESVTTTSGTTNFSNTATGCSNSATSYTYYSGQTLTAAVGTTCTVSITVGPLYPETVYLWVDWNADFDFLDAGEFVASGALPAGQTGAAQLPIPTGTASGTKRMRIRCVYNGSTTGVTACSIQQYGETEDYNLVVTGGTSPCAAPGNLTASNVTATSATMNWLATPGALGYEYVLDNSPSNPVSGFQVATTNTVTVSGLASSTTYYFHLRAVCSSGPSSWIDVPFNTSVAVPCFAPASVGVSSTNNSATLTWPPVTDATGYEYANTSSTAPPASGVPTTGLIATYSSLTAGTTYYAHVRSACGGSFSPWQTTLYTTSTTSVANVGGSSLSISATPNPASDKLTVRVEGMNIGKSATLTLTDMAGRVLRHAPVTSAETEFNLAGIPAGIYLLQYTGADRTGVIRVQKL